MNLLMNWKLDLYLNVDSYVANFFFNIVLILLDLLLNFLIYWLRMDFNKAFYKIFAIVDLCFIINLTN